MDGRVPGAVRRQTVGRELAPAGYRVFAEGGASGPLDTINNLSDLVFQCVRAVGVIVAGYGIVQIGLAVQSHDSSQRANGFLAFFGGLLIMFAKEILDFITV